MNQIDKVFYSDPVMRSFDQIPTEKRIRDRHIYDKTIWMDFEYLKMPVPAGYDAYLTNRYGDYMTPQNVSNTHGGVIFDTEMDYKEYLSKLKCNEN